MRPPTSRAWALPAVLGLPMYAIALAALSPALSHGLIDRVTAANSVAIVGVLAGAAYFITLLLLRHCAHLADLRMLLAAAIVARLIVCASPPMLETDYQRYLWDGASIIAGVNPYRHAPASALAMPSDQPDAPALARLIRDSAAADNVHSKINHPEVRTVYPPLAQAVFALAALLRPFDPLGLRLVFAAADALAAVLILRLLRTLNLPDGQLAWYVLNPLLLREVYSGVHMEALLLPMIAGAALLAAGHRHMLASCIAAAASAVKVWPAFLIIALLPRGSPRRLVLAGIAAGAVIAALWAPVLSVTHDHTSGFVAYTERWQFNDGFFRASTWALSNVLPLFSVDASQARSIMRPVAAALVLLTAFWVCRRPPAGVTDSCRRMLIITASLFLLSPTQFPWYWLWLLPMLTVIPAPALLLYTVLLPIYILQEYVMSPWINAAQHAPVWAALGLTALVSLLSHPQEHAHA